MLTKDGIILIDKEEGWTSQDVCSRLKKILDTPKIGHTGTLDPFATGLLIVAINEGTKISRFIEEKDKCYIARLVLGELKDTGDKTGKTIETASIPKLDKQTIENVFKSFIGKGMQLPPMYSALKHNGVPLYKLARNGEMIERKERKIEIFSLNLLSFDKNSIIFSAHVSKGTYIRTLGEDIAKKLNTYGYLSDLRRTKVGLLNVNSAYKVNDVKEEHIIALKDALPFKNIIADENIYKRAINGNDLMLNIDDELLLITTKEKELLGIYEKVDKNHYHCIRGFKK